MTQATKSVLTFALLLIGGTLSALAQSAPQPQTTTPRIDPETLRKRYQEIWDSVDTPKKLALPSMVVHLGASAGNRITAWAKSENGLKASASDWGIACHGTDAVSVEEEVHDPSFGVSKLAITRNDANTTALPCTLSMGGSSAEVVVPVLPPSPGEGRFSFLAYSCNEPFSTSGREGILARDLSLWLRMDARASGENSGGQLPERPQFVLGVGDQIYVDPDPKRESPGRLSFFEGDRSDQWLVENDPASLHEMLKIVYRYNFSLPPLASAFSKLPSFMMWDDHEIRDGWGSQGDESCDPTKGDGRRDPAMCAYFRVARHAFIAHQLLRSYAPGEIKQRRYKELVDGSETLHRQFDYGERTHVLMLDSRSTRAPNGRIFEETASRAVRDWLGRGRSGQGDLYVLTVGAPLFPSRTRAGGVARAFEPEIKDDLDDGWDSDINECSRADLLKLLAGHFNAKVNENDRLLVISGDVHYSSLYYLSLNGRVVGQEVVTSGIAHSLPSVARKSNWLLDTANQVEGFGVYAAGKINDSATFAEFIVEPGPPNQTPEVELVFHLNGTRAGRNVVLGNTNLLAPRNRRLWYHNYRYDYEDPLEHLTAARDHAYSTGATPAGAIVPLLRKLPPVRSGWLSFFLKPFGRTLVQSGIQAQSVFCIVSDTKYDKTPARDWKLNELRSCCLRLKP